MKRFYRSKVVGDALVGATQISENTDSKIKFSPTVIRRFRIGIAADEIHGAPISSKMFGHANLQYVRYYTEAMAINRRKTLTREGR